MTNGAAQEPGRHYFERGAQANAMQSCCRYRAGFTQLPRAHVAVTGPGFHDNLASLFLDKPRTASLLLPLLAPVLPLQARVYGTAKYALRHRLPAHSLLHPPTL